MCDNVAVTDRVYEIVGVQRGQRLPTYTSVGCYTVVYYTRQCEPVCGKCATLYDDVDDPITLAGSYDEGPTLECSVCSGEIESSYGPVSDDVVKSEEA